MNTKLLRLQEGLRGGRGSEGGYGGWGGGSQNSAELFPHRVYERERERESMSPIPKGAAISQALRLGGQGALPESMEAEGQQLPDFPAQLGMTRPQKGEQPSEDVVV